MKLFVFFADKNLKMCNLCHEETNLTLLTAAVKICDKCKSFLCSKCLSNYSKTHVCVSSLTKRKYKNIKAYNLHFTKTLISDFNNNVEFAKKLVLTRLFIHLSTSQKENGNHKKSCNDHLLMHFTEI